NHPKPCSCAPLPAATVMLICQCCDCIALSIGVFIFGFSTLVTPGNAKSHFPYVWDSTDLYSQACTCLPSHVSHLEWDSALDVEPGKRPEDSPASL
ncbi:hypothetical protein J0S82_003978, partial [Galemys pyrenaicus]